MIINVVVIIYDYDIYAVVVVICVGKHPFCFFYILDNILAIIFLFNNIKIKS